MFEDALSKHASQTDIEIAQIKNKIQIFFLPFEDFLKKLDFEILHLEALKVLQNFAIKNSKKNVMQYILNEDQLEQVKEKYKSINEDYAFVFIQNQIKSQAYKAMTYATEDPIQFVIDKPNYDEFLSSLFELCTTGDFRSARFNDLSYGGIQHILDTFENRGKIFYILNNPESKDYDLESLVSYIKESDIDISELAPFIQAIEIKINETKPKLKKFKRKAKKLKKLLKAAKQFKFDKLPMKDALKDINNDYQFLSDDIEYAKEIIAKIS